MSRFDPNANAHALLGGVSAGTHLGGLLLRQQEAQQAAAQQELMNGLLMAREQRAAQDHAAQMAEIQRANAQQAAAQQYFTSQFQQAQAPEIFAPGGQAIPNDNDAFFQAAGQLQQETGQFATLPPAIQQNILQPMMRRLEVTQRRERLAQELRTKFPEHPEVVMDALDSFDLQHLGGFNDREVMDIKNARPFDVTEYRNRLLQAGASPDMATAILTAREGVRQGVPATTMNTMLRPHTDPLALEDARQDNRLELLNHRADLAAKAKQLTPEQKALRMSVVAKLKPGWTAEQVEAYVEGEHAGMLNQLPANVGTDPKRGLSQEDKDTEAAMRIQIESRERQLDRLMKQIGDETNKEKKRAMILRADGMNAELIGLEDELQNFVQSRSQQQGPATAPARPSAPMPAAPAPAPAAAPIQPTTAIPVVPPSPPGGNPMLSQPPAIPDTNTPTPENIARMKAAVQQAKAEGLIDPAQIRARALQLLSGKP